jgi:hypothetical protein
MIDILITTNRENELVFSDYLDNNADSSDLYNSAGFSGSDELIRFVAQVVLPALPSIALIVQTLINSKKSFSLKMKSKESEELTFEYQGNNPKKAIEDMFNTFNNNDLGKKIVSHFIDNQSSDNKPDGKNTNEGE